MKAAATEPEHWILHIGSMRTSSGQDNIGFQRRVHKMWGLNPTNDNAYEKSCLVYRSAYSFSFDFTPGTEYLNTPYHVLNIEKNKELANMPLNRLRKPDTGPATLGDLYKLAVLGNQTLQATWGYTYAQYRFLISAAMIVDCTAVQWLTISDDDTFVHVPRLQKRYLQDLDSSVPQEVAVFDAGCSPTCGGYGLTYSRSAGKLLLGGSGKKLLQHFEDIIMWYDVELGQYARQTRINETKIHHFCARSIGEPPHEWEGQRNSYGTFKCTCNIDSVVTVHGKLSREYGAFFHDHRRIGGSLSEEVKICSIA